MGALNLIKWKDCSGHVHKFRLINRVSSKWESFGYLLDIHHNVLTGWRDECLGNSARCWMKVMAYWLTEGHTPQHPATWEGLYVMLEDVDFVEVAKELREAIFWLSCGIY